MTGLPAMKKALNAPENLFAAAEARDKQNSTAIGRIYTNPVREDQLNRSMQSTHVLLG